MSARLPCLPRAEILDDAAALELLNQARELNQFHLLSIWFARTPAVFPDLWPRARIGIVVRRFAVEHRSGFRFYTFIFFSKQDREVSVT